MNLFQVYQIYNITPVKGQGIKLWDPAGIEYLDFYGGHGVMSIGHSHPAYVKAVSEQVATLGFYSNSVRNPLQEALAEKLAAFSGYPDYRLFLCNSGAEANENALKLASFHTGKRRTIAFHDSFHGRTSAAVSVTHNQSIAAPLNRGHDVVFLLLNDLDAVNLELAKGDVCAVIIEGIQGVGGLNEGSTIFFQALAKSCQEHQVVLILDEIQSGYGRTGHFFAHQHHGIQPDIISVAKGMGNGFPVGGILISPKFTASPGMLGTTFGGNHLAAAAALAVLEVIEKEDLIAHASELEHYFKQQASQFPDIKKVKGRGLLLGLEFDFDVAALRKRLLYHEHILTGNAAQKNLLRILPPLCVHKADITLFFAGLEKALTAIKQTKNSN